MIKIGCVAIVPHESGKGFHGIRCGKGRGIILPGGRYEKDVDLTYHHTACRELFEEMGLVTTPEDLEYLWHGPDGGDFITFAFLVKRYSGVPQETKEGIPVHADWNDLMVSHFAGWYACLKDVLDQRSRLSFAVDASGALTVNY